MTEPEVKRRALVLEESPHERSDWEDLLRDMVYSRGDGTEITRPLDETRGRPYFVVDFPGSMKDEEVDAAVVEIGAAGEDLLRRDRRSWARAATAALEEREKVLESLSQTRRALALVEETRKGVTGAADMVKATETLAKAAAIIGQAWAWLT